MLLCTRSIRPKAIFFFFRRRGKKDRPIWKPAGHCWILLERVSGILPGRNARETGNAISITNFILRCAMQMNLSGGYIYTRICNPDKARDTHLLREYIGNGDLPRRVEKFSARKPVYFSYVAQRNGRARALFMRLLKIVGNVVPISSGSLPRPITVSRITRTPHYHHASPVHHLSISFKL